MDSQELEIRYMHPRFDTLDVVVHEHAASIDAHGNGETTRTTNGEPHIHLIQDHVVRHAGHPPHDHHFLPDGTTVHSKERSF